MSVVEYSDERRRANEEASGSDRDTQDAHRSTTVQHSSNPLKRRHRDHRPDDGRPHGWFRFAQHKFSSASSSSVVADIAPFKFHPAELKRIVRWNDFLTLNNEGASELLQGLLTNIKRGIATHEALDDDQVQLSSNEGQSPVFVSLAERRRIYGMNRAWEGSWKIVARLLHEPWELAAPIVYANLALIVLGLLDDFVLRSANDRRFSWVVSIVVIGIVVAMAFFQILIRWNMALQIQALHDETEGPRVTVVRDGYRQKIYTKDIVVGDIVFLEAGGVVPCDGVFLSGHGVACGELKVKKVTIEHMARMVNHSDPRIKRADCFLRAGDKVFGGSGRYVVTAVNNIGGSTPLPFDMYDRQVWSEEGYISERSLRKDSILVAPLLFPLFTIKLFIQLDDDPTGVLRDLTDIFILWIFLVMIVYLPQRLSSPISTQHSLMKHLIGDKVLVQVPHSCESMTKVTDLCTDMTGTITQDRMTVISGLVGTYTKFQRDQATNPSSGAPSHLLRHSVDLEALNICLSPTLQHIFKETITLTCTAIQDVDPITGEAAFLGSATEVALLQFAKELGWLDLQSPRTSIQILEMIPFASSRMASGAFVDLGEGRCRLYLKGASEVLAQRCTRYVLVDEDVDGEIQTSFIDPQAENVINRTITSYTEDGLRTISLCYRDFDSWPPNGASHSEHDDIEYESCAHDMTFVGMVCIYNPIRPGVRAAVLKLQGAGINVRMCTGDHPATAEAIARQCGISAGHQIAVKGSTFSEREQNARRSRPIGIQVLARSSPEEKALFVNALKRREKVVAFLGDGTNDQLALQAANVSFSMAVTGTEISKASDIVVLDQDFNSVFKVLQWGRWLKESRGQFVDLYIPTSLTIIFLTFISSLASSTSEPALSLVQILWITLLINPLAVLALSTDQPWLDNTGPQISSSLPGIYYLFAETLIVLFLFIFGHRFPGHSVTESTVNVSDRTRTLIFNTMAFMQIFRTLTYWKVNRKRLLHVNWMFPITLTCGVAAHLSAVLKGGSTFHVTPMSGAEWGSSIALSAFSVPLAFTLNQVRNVAEMAASKFI